MNQWDVCRSIMINVWGSLKSALKEQATYPTQPFNTPIKPVMRFKTFISLSVSLLLTLFCLAAPSWAIDVSPGDRVELQARNRLGVPLHETSSSSLVGRAPDGAIVDVLDTANDQRWVEIDFEGLQRWVTERYISRVIPKVIEDPIEDPDLEDPSPDPDEDPGEMPEQILPGLTGAELRSRLAQDYQVETSLGYNRARDYMYSQLDNDNGTVRGIYSDFAVTVNPNSSRPRSDAFNQGINAEHSWPQSKGATGVAKSDLHHLFPARANVNSRRGNLPFADINDEQTQRWILDDEELQEIPTINIDAYSESTRDAFEPRESVKGNIARAMFYFNTVYGNQAEPGFFDDQEDTLCEWAVADPVDGAEVERSHAIASQQGNENPFVLDPSLAQRVYCSSNSF